MIFQYFIVYKLFNTSIQFYVLLFFIKCKFKIKILILESVLIVFINEIKGIDILILKAGNGLGSKMIPSEII